MMTLASLALLTFVRPDELVLSPRELAPGVFVLPSSSRYGAANLGWVVLQDRIILIGVPERERLPQLLDQIRNRGSKPITTGVILQLGKDEIESAAALALSGIEIVIHQSGVDVLKKAIEPGQDREAKARTHIRAFGDHLEMGDAGLKIEVLSQGRVAGPANAAVYLPRPQVLFAGAVCIHGPRAELPGTDTLQWLSALEQLQKMPCRTVVPGRGSVGDVSLLDRETRFLRELRRQVGHLVAQSRRLDDIVKEVKVPPGYLVWMPYDQPIREDVEHVYRELTVPLAPFGERGSPRDSKAPGALVLIGDSPHDPDAIDVGLRRALGQAGIVPYVTVDVRALSAQNLKQVQLLVVLRDGLIWPHGRDRPAVGWMTPDQERAVVDFVECGGGLLALHNATALYPEGGPFLELIGGSFDGHGPLERFRVIALDHGHPITRGVAAFEVADEQHTPVPDLARVHLLLESQSAEGIKGAAGWVRQVGRGRVCYLANGHTREALDHPEFQRLVRNAAFWCLAGHEDGHS